MAVSLPQAPEGYDQSNEQQTRRELEDRITDIEAVLQGLQTTYGTLSMGEQSIELATPNGANDDVPIGYATYVRITNASGAFTIGGMTGGERGRFLVLRNVGAYAMTIEDEEGSSTAENRIVTQTGADVVLTNTGGNSAVFTYDATSARWILLATQG